MRRRCLRWSLRWIFRRVGRWLSSRNRCRLQRGRISRLVSWRSRLSSGLVRGLVRRLERGRRRHGRGWCRRRTVGIAPLLIVADAPNEVFYAQKVLGAIRRLAHLIVSVNSVAWLGGEAVDRGRPDRRVRRSPAICFNFCPVQFGMIYLLQIEFRVLWERAN